MVRSSKNASGLSFAADDNGTGKGEWDQALGIMSLGLVAGRHFWFAMSAIFGSGNKKSMLGKYSEITDINTTGNIVLDQVRKGIPGVDGLSKFPKMTDIIGDRGSSIQASRRTFMPTGYWTLERTRKNKIL